MSTNSPKKINICEAVKPVYNCSDMKGLAEEIRNDLNGIFSFSESNYKILYLGNKEHENEYLEILKKLYKSEIDSGKFDPEKYLKNIKSKEGTCEYLGDSVENIDYVIIVPESHIPGSVNPQLPFIFGEEITHGEHVTSNMRRLKNYEEFWENFSALAEEFMGNIGFLYVKERLTPSYTGLLEKHGVIPILGEQPKIKGNGILEIDMPHIVGYQVSRQFFNKLNKEKGNYSDVFNAKNEGEIWEIVNGKLTPTIKIILPEKPVFKEIVEESFEQISRSGLKTKRDVVFNNRLFESQANLTEK